MGSEFFLVMYWGLKIKSPWGREAKPPRPPISQIILPTISNIQKKKKKKGLQNKSMYCGGDSVSILVKKWPFTFSLCAFANNE